MPDISLFEPQVLRGVVEKLTTPQNLVLLNEVPQDSHPFPTISWDVIEGQRNIAQPNVPNSEGKDPHELPRRTVQGRAQKSAFLSPASTVIQACGAKPCFSGGWAGP